MYYSVFKLQSTIHTSNKMHSMYKVQFGNIKTIKTGYQHQMEISTNLEEFSTCDTHPPQKLNFPTVLKAFLNFSDVYYECV